VGRGEEEKRNDLSSFQLGAGRKKSWKKKSEGFLRLVPGGNPTLSRGDPESMPKTEKKPTTSTRPPSGRETGPFS